MGPVVKTVLVTHTEAADHPPRLLTAAGLTSAAGVAVRIGEIMGAAWRIRKAVSSPAVRCVQTALAIIPALADDRLRRLDTDPRLMAAKDAMEPDQLFRALADYPCEGLLVVLHADLANALAALCLPAGAVGGWFSLRPVLCVLDWVPERPIDENRILILEGPERESLLPPGYETPSNRPLQLT